jgi:AAHS family 4-hydroxybenzoate transporter-like MFS transporter
MIGAVLGGVVSAWLIPAHGWRSVFWAGGIVPLLLVVPMLFWLPESLQLLAVRGARPDRIARWARRLDPSSPHGAHVRYVAREARREGLPLVELFRAGRAPATALLWVVSFLNVLNAYFLASWLPTAVRDAGHATSSAVLGPVLAAELMLRHWSHAELFRAAAVPALVAAALTLVMRRLRPGTGARAGETPR